MSNFSHLELGCQGGEMLEFRPFLVVFSSMKPRKSELLFRKSQEIFAGGVNSPVRSFKAVGGSPRFMTRGKGPWVWDADGQRYIDFCMSWGAGILGHAPTSVTAAVTKTARRGLSFGTPT